MKPMLEIIMPHYNEPWELVKPFFDVLSSQRGIDFDKLSVHVVHDGGNVFPLKKKDTPFKVVQSVIKHGGVSKARNYGLDHAKAKWVLFCDCDDTFSNVYALKFIFDVLDTEDYDMIWGAFFVEHKTTDGGLALRVNDQFNSIWIHCRMFRLDFLRAYNIRFNEDLYFSEDSAFNAIVNMEIDPKRIGTLKTPIPSYVWCWREGSATLDKKNWLKNIKGQFMRNVYVISEYRKRGDDFSAVRMVGRTMTDMYAHMTRTDVEGLDTLKSMVKDFYDKEREAFDSLTVDDITKVMNASLKEGTDCNYLNPDRPTFSEWLKGFDE